MSGRWSGRYTRFLQNREFLGVFRHRLKECLGNTLSLIDFSLGLENIDVVSVGLRIQNLELLEAAGGELGLQVEVSTGLVIRFYFDLPFRKVHSHFPLESKGGVGQD